VITALGSVAALVTVLAWIRNFSSVAGAAAALVALMGVAILSLQSLRSNIWRHDPTHLALVQDSLTLFHRDQILGSIPVSALLHAQVRQYRVRSFPSAWPVAISPALVLDVHGFTDGVQFIQLGVPRTAMGMGRGAFRARRDGEITSRRELVRFTRRNMLLPVSATDLQYVYARFENRS